MSQLVMLKTLTPFQSVDSSGVNYTNVELFEITADDFIQFSFTLTDFDLNQITNTKPHG